MASGNPDEHFTMPPKEIAGWFLGDRDRRGVGFGRICVVVEA
jgi:hypothetical protein